MMNELNNLLANIESALKLRNQELLVPEESGRLLADKQQAERKRIE
jgi:hypothetical protein